MAKRVPSNEFYIVTESSVDEQALSDVMDSVENGRYSGDNIVGIGVTEREALDMAREELESEGEFDNDLGLFLFKITVSKVRDLDVTKTVELS
jgi:hypothetical protein